MKEAANVHHDLQVSRLNETERVLVRRLLFHVFPEAFMERPAGPIPVPEVSVDLLADVAKAMNPEGCRPWMSDLQQELLADVCSIEQIAIVCHEANRALCLTFGDESQLPWADAAQWQRDSCLAGVKAIVHVEITNPAGSHASWMANKVAEGWVYGPTKDPVAKTHPCLVPWESLDPEQQIKDLLFFGIVRALCGCVPA